MIKGYLKFINENSDEFTKLRDKLLSNEEKIAKEGNFPNLDKYLKRIEDMKSINDPKIFIKKYKSLTGATDWDLPNDIFRFS